MPLEIRKVLLNAQAVETGYLAHSHQGLSLSEAE